MSDNNEPDKTPVSDLLRSIPHDLVIQFEHDRAWHNCPIGSHAQEAAATIQSLTAENEKLREALLQLKHGDCWCEVGIGNPMYTNHSAACLEVQQIITGKKED